MAHSIKAIAATGMQADFRLAHLNAHLSMHEILSKQQIDMYDQVRGYAGASSGPSSDKHP